MSESNKTDHSTVIQAGLIIFVYSEYYYGCTVKFKFINEMYRITWLQTILVVNTNQLQEQAKTEKGIPCTEELVVNLSGH